VCTDIILRIIEQIHMEGLAELVSQPQDPVAFLRAYREAVQASFLARWLNTVAPSERMDAP